MALASPSTSHPGTQSDIPVDLPPPRHRDGTTRQSTHQHDTGDLGAGGPRQTRNLKAAMAAMVAVSIAVLTLGLVVAGSPGSLTAR